MRRFLTFSAVWTVSVLAATMSFSACNRTGRDATIAAADTALPRAIERVREVTIPRGTSLTFALDDSVGSATSRVDERVRAHLTRPVVIDGAPVVPAGSELSGAVLDALPSHRVKGRARIGIKFNSLQSGSDSYAIAAPAIVRSAPSQVKKDTMKVAIPAAAGAVLGGVLGGGKGAVIGGAVGGGAGAGYVLSQHGPDVVLRAGTALSVKLSEPITVRVREQLPAQEVGSLN
jgi:hypothetical protein